MKKVLMIASVASMIQQFNMSNIKLLLELGFHVDVACNFDNGNTCSKESIEVLKSDLTKIGVRYCQIDFSRRISKLKEAVKAYKQVKNLLQNNKYVLIHCHSPIGGVLTRLAAKKTRKNGTKVIYTAHGFHFFKGASLINWLLYYPIEKYCSRFTDALITINQEDYKLAKNRMKAKEIYYVPGVGVDIDKFANVVVDPIKKRAELGIPPDAIMLLSVGELNENKNHEVIIRALSKINHSQIHYCIAGKGELKNYLLDLAQQLDLLNNIHLLGYRNDIAELCNSADIFCFPSYREGLGLSALEAMAAGLSVIAAINRGTNEYSKDGITGFICEPTNVDRFAQAILKLSGEKGLREKMGKYNSLEARKFSISDIGQRMEEIYKSIG